MNRRLLACILLLTFVQSCAIGAAPSTGAVDWDNIRYTPYEVDDEPRDSSV